MTAVFVVKTTPSYPEFPYPITGSDLPSALRSLFALWGKDPSNPFADLASPGSCVLIKPNWVLDHNSSGYNIDSLITHSALIKYLIDFLIIALKGQGRIIIGDAPIQGCNFNNLIGLSRIKDVIEDVRRRHPEIEVNIEDWRLTVFDRPPGKITWLKTGEQRSITRAANSIPKTHFIVDLGKDSFLEEISEYCNRFRVAMYNPNLMVDHHKPGTHEYVVTNRIFEANLIINLPKMKTHHKAGLTGALKNIVGINGHKEYLPHHIKGSYFEGGDNYCIPNRLHKYYENLEDHLWRNYDGFSKIHRQMYSLCLMVLWKLAKIYNFDRISPGGWSGNETIWRMTLDLNHFLYFNNIVPCKIITIVDGVIGGEGEGPLTPMPKPVGLLIGGENPAYVDAVIAKLMGYNVARIPTVYQAIYNRRSKFAEQPLESFEVNCIFSPEVVGSIPFCKLPNLGFIKPKYWKRSESFIR